jgi:PAS domain S-box-containing protein
LIPAYTAAPASHDRLSGAQFLRRFRWLIFFTWNIPPVFGLSFILLVGILTADQMVGILLSPLEPAYIVGWLAFAMWYFARQMGPLADWLDRKPQSTQEDALRAMRGFPVRFWAIFLFYLGIAPASVVMSAAIYTGYVTTPIALFRIELIALIVSIIVGLPIFFLILDLFGRAIGGIDLRRPLVTIRTKVFLIGALVPLLIDTMLVQYYWARTGYFTYETFGVWLLLEVLAIGGSLIFAHSFAQSLAPLRVLLAANQPLAEASVASLAPRSTDELGMITNRYRRLLEELSARADLVEVNNRILRTARASATTAEVVDQLLAICREAIFSDQVFLLLVDEAENKLVCVAHSDAPYDPAGHFRVSLGEQSLAGFAFHHRETVAVTDTSTDSRVSPTMRAAFGVRSSIAAPLQTQEGVIGALIANSRTAIHAYTPREVQMMESLAWEVAAILNLQRLRDARDAANAARRKREHLVQLLLQSTGEAIYGADLNGICTFVNPAALRMLGYRHEDDLVGNPIHTLIHHTYPDGRPYPKESCRVRVATLAGKSSHVVDEVHWRADGTSFPVEYRSYPIIEEGKLVGAVVSFVDITERKRAEQALVSHNLFLRTVASVNENLIRTRDEKELMASVCRILVEESHFRMAWIGLIEADGIHVRPAAEAGFDESYLAKADIRCDESPAGRGPTGTAIRFNKTVINNDTETNEQFAPWREQARAQGYRSSASTPLRVGNRTVGTVNVYSAEAQAFDADRIVLFERLATDLGHALERGAAEAALRESEARTSLLLKSTAEGIYGVDMKGVCTFVNPAAMRILGYEKEGDLIGKCIHALIHHSYADGRPHPEEECTVRRSTLEGKPAHADDEVHWRADGSSFPVEYWSHPMYRNGELVGAVVTFVDITERKRAEQALRETEFRLRTVVKAAPVVVFAIDRQGTFLVSEGAALANLDLSPGEVVGKNAFDVYADTPHIIEQLKRALAGEAFTTHSEVANRIYEVHYAPVRDESGELTGTIGIAIDDTERTTAERELQRYRETLEQLVAARTAELEAVNKELEAFSYSVSHDLRAPLRGIDGFSQALLEDYSDRLDDTGKDYLRRVRAGAQRMATLIDDMLTLSRVTRAIMQPQTVDLSALGREIVAELVEPHPARQVDVHIAPDMQASGDAGLLRTALENLIGNAWKYSAKRADARIEFGRMAQAGETVFFVRDNGAGFDMRYAGKLFHAFQRLHHPSDFEGTGIGLATVQRIVHRHGGRIWAEAAPGEGATFYFTLGSPGSPAGE